MMFVRIFQGRKSAQGISRLWNPNVGPNSGKWILDARILDPNCLTLFFVPAKEAPWKIHPRETHLPEFTFQNSTQKSGQKIHIAPLQGHLWWHFFGEFVCNVVRARSQFWESARNSVWGPEKKNQKNSRGLWRSRRRKSSSVPAGVANFPAAIFLAGKCPNLGRNSISCCQKIGE